MKRFHEAREALDRIETRIRQMTDPELDALAEKRVGVFFQTYLKILVADERRRRAGLTAHQRIDELRARKK